MRYILIIMISINLFADMKVIVSNNSQIKTITQKTLKRLFLGKTKKLNGKKVIVLDNIDAYDEFYKKIIKKSKKQIHSYWMKQIFLGKKRPPKKIKFNNIVKKLNSNPIIITYTNKDLNAKVIYETK